MSEGTGIRLEFSDRRQPITRLAEVNDVLAATGTRLWPLDLSDIPAAIGGLLRKPRLSPEDQARLRDHFLLPRQRLLEIIRDAGRVPQAENGGSLETFVVNHGYGYPHLYVVEDGVDYSRFDRFHVNVAEDGSSIDEVFQQLCGDGFEVVQRLSDGSEFCATLDCIDTNSGWLGTYSGADPHQGRVSRARPGTKILVQAIGAPRWSLKYVDGA
jgi:hypothetical protein